MFAEEIQKKLSESFSISEIRVHDDSQRHRKHKEAKGKGGHYELLIVSDDFQGMPLLERHRKIYEVLDMKASEIHALSISAWTNQEWKKKNVHSG